MSDYPDKELLKSKKRGITLIELLIAMSTSLIIAGVISAVFISSWKAQIAQEEYTELQQKGRKSVDEISSSIKVASGVITSITSGSDTYITSDLIIVLKTPAIDGSDNILPATDYFVFQLNVSDATKLERIIIADGTSIRTNLAATTTLSNVMGTLSFIYYDDSTGSVLVPGTDDITTTTSVFVEVDSQGDFQGRTINRILDNLVYLRNLP